MNIKFKTVSICTGLIFLLSCTKKPGYVSVMQEANTPQVYNRTLPGQHLQDIKEQIMSNIPITINETTIEQDTTTDKEETNTLQLESLGEWELTAYTLREEECGKAPSHPAYGITARGTYVQEWQTIAGPKELAFGTKIYIPYFKDQPNKGIFIVEDRG